MPRANEMLVIRNNFTSERRFAASGNAVEVREIHRISFRDERGRAIEP